MRLPAGPQMPPKDTFTPALNTQLKMVDCNQLMYNVQPIDITGGPQMPPKDTTTSALNTQYPIKDGK